jgi:hypothetical protein
LEHASARFPGLPGALLPRDCQTFAVQVQVHQREVRAQAVMVLRDASVSHLVEAEDALQRRPPVWIEVDRLMFVSGNPVKKEADQERVGVTQVLASGFLTAGTDPVIFDFAGIVGLSAAPYEGAELLATNSGELDSGFAICTKCGFADSMRSSSNDLPRSSEGVDFSEHLPLRARRTSKNMLAQGRGVSYAISAPRRTA